MCFSPICEFSTNFFFGAFGANTFPRDLNLEKDGFKNFGMSEGGGGGFEQATPLRFRVAFFQKRRG